jgi:transposase-like protein
MRRLLADQVRYSLPGREVPVECPDCESQTMKPIGWIMEHHRFRCPDCDALFELNSERFRELFGEAWARARDLDEAIRQAELASSA